MAKSYDVDHARRLFAEFINEHSLYSPFEIELENENAFLDVPKNILRFCPQCDATPTWRMIAPDRTNSDLYVATRVGFVIAYMCSHCEKQIVTVWFSEVKKRTTASGPMLQIFRKHGQWPAMSIQPDREIEKAFKDESTLDLFKKGLTSLSQGYGIGALAYFRRVVEQAAMTLIDIAAEQAAAADDITAEQTIKAAKEQKKMEDRLRLAADALPASLRPGKVNPLSVLFSHYSQGMHNASDDECLAVASQLRFALEYFFKNWKRQMEEADRFRETVQKWSGTKAE